MKTIIYSRPFWPSIGGVEVTSRILAQALVELGHSVSVFTSTLLKGQAELNEGYKIYRSENLLSFMRLARTADVVVIDGGVSAFAGLGAIIPRVPAIIVWHQMAGSYEHYGNSVKTRLTNIVRRQIVRRTCAHVGVTKACLESKDLIPIEGCIRRVIYNPVSEELAAQAALPANARRTIDVLFVGRLIEGKGILVLAEALRRLDGAGLPVRVRIVGDGADRNRMESLLRELHSVSVTFSGSETGSALARSYASARVLVVPSTTHPEGMGIVVAEGMAFGLPVIVTDQPALCEVVGDTGLIVSSGDSEALAAALRSLLCNGQLWVDLSKRARQRSELFNMSRFRRSIADLIGEVAQQCQI